MFENNKRLLGKGKGTVRYVRNIGLGFKTPAEVGNEEYEEMLWILRGHGGYE